MTGFVTRAAALLAVPLLLVGCSGGGSGKDTGSVTTTGAADAQTATVDMGADLKFRPSTVLARVGTVTLTANNTGQVPHDLVFDDKALGKTGTVDGKTSEPLKVTFSKAGTYTFTCTFHSGMAGKVVVS
ncbi:MAG: Cupredoxin-like domain [Frankiales bacterium]|jgi:plastocyanin|nr:Cupredoxin-like domain [Frankiales bacterium]